MHGYKKPESVLRGSEHPAYLHGAATNEARETNRQNSLELHRLLALGKSAGIFSPEVALRGRKPSVKVSYLERKSTRIKMYKSPNEPD
jgi:hypothetical protein